jgi:hypothetical protein
MAVSEKQLTFITSLIDRREAMFRNAGQSEQANAIAEMKTAILAEAQSNHMTVKDGSKSIERMQAGNDRISEALKSIIEAKRAEQRAAAPKKEDLSDGFYSLDDTIYKVVTSKAGRQYAKELVTRKYSDEKGDSEREFVYAPGIINRLTPEHALTLEEAEQYGQLYGRCLNCGRVLSNEESIARAMGPVCAGKFG